MSANRMPPRQKLFACPSCARHVKQAEPRCPHCGVAIRSEGGAVQRTAAAVLLGLTTALSSTMMGCAYGTGPSGPGGGSGSGGATGGGTATSEGTGGTTTGDNGTTTGAGGAGGATAGTGGSGGQ